MRRRQRQEDPVPPDLRVFRLEHWLVFVDGEPSEDYIRSRGELCSSDLWRWLEAQRLWADARSRWAEEHAWPGGTVTRLQEQVAARGTLFEEYERFSEPAGGGSATFVARQADLESPDGQQSGTVIAAAFGRPRVNGT